MSIPPFSAKSVARTKKISLSALRNSLRAPHFQISSQRADINFFPLIFFFLIGATDHPEKKRQLKGSRSYFHLFFCSATLFYHYLRINVSIRAFAHQPLPWPNINAKLLSVDCFWVKGRGRFAVAQILTLILIFKVNMTLTQWTDLNKIRQLRRSSHIPNITGLQIMTTMWHWSNWRTPLSTTITWGLCA